MTSTTAMLPEWAEQEAVMLAWPHDGTDWRPWLEAIEHDYVELAVAIAGEASPFILCRDEAHRGHIRKLLADRCAHAPRFAIVPYNDTWCRDYGPVTLRKEAETVLLDFQFVGWGDKYDAALDNRVNQALSDEWAVPLKTVAFELEGGSIETDGQGSLLSTRHCLLESNRNRQYGREKIQQLVLTTLGLRRMLWIGEGSLEGDDTDSHIDNLVRFCAPDALAFAACSREDDAHHGPLRKLGEEVARLRQGDGSPYRLFPLELPSPVLDESGKRLPGSYANFLILNGSVIVPVFDCEEDAQALATLRRCFPGKHIVPVPGGNLVRQFGGPHCATMQLPRGVLKPRRDDSA